MPEGSRGARSLWGGGGQRGRSGQGCHPCQHGPHTPMSPFSPQLVWAPVGQPVGAGGRVAGAGPHSPTLQPQIPSSISPWGPNGTARGGGAMLSLLTVPMAIPLPWYPLRLPWQRDAACSGPPSGRRVCGHTHTCTCTHTYTHTRTHTRTHLRSRGAARAVPQFPLPNFESKGEKRGTKTNWSDGDRPRVPPTALWATPRCPLSPSRAGSVRGS